MGKPWYIHTAEFHSAIKRNEPTTHPASSMKQDIRLNETSQYQNVVYFVIPLTWRFRKVKNYTKSEQIRSCQGLGMRKRDQVQGAKGTVWGGGIRCVWTVGTVVRCCMSVKIDRNVHLKRENVTRCKIIL